MNGQGVSWGASRRTHRVQKHKCLWNEECEVAERTRIWHTWLWKSRWHWHDQNTPSTALWASEPGCVYRVVSTQADNSDSAYWPDLLMTWHRSHTSSKHNSKIDHTLSCNSVRYFALAIYCLILRKKHRWGCLTTNILRIYLDLKSAKQQTPEEKCIMGKCMICMAHEIPTKER